MNKQFKSGIQIKSASLGEVEAVFATMGLWDKDNDFTTRGAFGVQDNIPLEGWNHNYSLPVGTGRIFERGNDAVFAGRFFMQTQSGRDHFEVVKEMAAAGRSEWSYSFTVLDSNSATNGGRPGKILKRLEVFGVSPVTRGAGEFTRVLSLSKGYSPGRLTVGAALAQINALDPPGNLKRRLDAELMAMYTSELQEVEARLGVGNESLLTTWREQLAADGHAPNWIESVINGKVWATAQQLAYQNPLTYASPVQAMGAAYKRLAKPAPAG